MRPFNAAEAKGAKLFRKREMLWHNPQVVWRLPHEPMGLSKNSF
jgi:hypothetical protein